MLERQAFSLPLKLFAYNFRSFDALISRVSSAECRLSAPGAAVGPGGFPDRDPLRPPPRGAPPSSEAAGTAGVLRCPFLGPRRYLFSYLDELCRDCAAEFVLDMGADDLVEGCFRLEAEGNRPAGIEILRPAGDHPGYRLVGLVADQLHRLVAGDAPERLDLFADGRA